MLENVRPPGYRVGDSPIGWAGSYRSLSGPSRVVWKYSPNTGVEFLPKLNTGPLERAADLSGSYKTNA
jgi:hypothetical protein